MGLQTSTPGVTNDLTAATNIETNWPIIDVHDHSSGKGSQVPSAGININAHLNFGGFKPYNLLANQFSNQSSSLSTATNKPCVYVLNGELRYIDNSGNDVQITNSGSVAGASGTISGLSSPVAAGFSSGTFSWQANSGTGLYAKMSNADINLYEASAGVTNAVTLKSPTSLAASYSVLFPTATPASTSYVTMANTGQLATASADSIGQAMTSTGANAIAATRTRSTGTSVSAGGIGISNECTSFSSSSITMVDVTNLTVQITTSGRPVELYLIPTSTSSNTGYIQSQSSGSGITITNVAFLRDGSIIANILLSVSISGAGLTTETSYYTPRSIGHIDAVAAGTYTYKIQASTSGGTFIFNRVKLVAVEL